MTADLRAMLERATPGPWHSNCSHVYAPDEAILAVVQNPGSKESDYPLVANRDLIVAAVNALPSLLDEIEALREALKPFAAVADSFDKASFPVDDSAKLYTSFSGDITIGHMRKARLALQTPEGK